MARQAFTSATAAPIDTRGLDQWLGTLCADGIQQQATWLSRLLALEDLR